MKIELWQMRTSHLPILLFLFTPGVFLASEVSAQRVQLPEFPPLRGGDMGVIMDGAMFSAGSNMRVQMSLENGVKKIRAEEAGVKTYIEESPDTGILIKITRQYGPDQMDDLREKHPGLYMSSKDFPATTDDGATVEVTIGVTEKFAAANAEELEAEHPEIFKAYKKYSNGNSNMQIFRGRFGGDLLMPEFRIRPEAMEGGIQIIPSPQPRNLPGGIEIDPSDVKIHDPPNKNRAAEKADKDT